MHDRWRSFGSLLKILPNKHPNDQAISSGEVDPVRKLVVLLEFESVSALLTRFDEILLRWWSSDKAVVGSWEHCSMVD